ncbi:hypothetical protein IAU59_003688 [Kwoniella sp. CBS 9459]
MGYPMPTENKILSAVRALVDARPHRAFNAPAISLNVLTEHLQIPSSSIDPYNLEILLRPLASTHFGYPTSPRVKSVRSSGLKREYWIVFEPSTSSRGSRRPAQVQSEPVEGAQGEMAGEREHMLKMRKAAHRTTSISDLPRPPSRASRADRREKASYHHIKDEEEEEGENLVQGSVDFPVPKPVGNEPEFRRSSPPKTLDLIPTLPGGANYLSVSSVATQDRQEKREFFRSMGNTKDKFEQGNMSPQYTGAGEHIAADSRKEKEERARKAFQAHLQSSSELSAEHSDDPSGTEPLARSRQPLRRPTRKETIQGPGGEDSWEIIGSYEDQEGEGEEEEEDDDGRHDEPAKAKRESVNGQAEPSEGKQAAKEPPSPVLKGKSRNPQAEASKIERPESGKPASDRQENDGDKVDSGKYSEESEGGSGSDSETSNDSSSGEEDEDEDSTGTESDFDAEHVPDNTGTHTAKKTSSKIEGKHAISSSAKNTRSTDQVSVRAGSQAPRTSQDGGDHPDEAEGEDEMDGQIGDKVKKASSKHRSERKSEHNESSTRRRKQTGTVAFNIIEVTDSEKPEYSGQEESDEETELDGDEDEDGEEGPPPTPYWEKTFQDLPFGPDLPVLTIKDWLEDRWKILLAEIVIILGMVYIVQAIGL